MAVQGFNIFEYQSPIVSIKEGKAWIVDGHFKLVHVINLKKLEEPLEKMALVVKNEIKERERRVVAEHHLDQIKERFSLLKGRTATRKTRSINWLGSAWKWLAGNPDATDWNKVMQNEEDLAENSNQQFKINERVLGITDDITRKINWVISSSNNQIASSNEAKFEQDLINEIMVIKEEVSEIVRACQMARSGIVNTNLLDREEINRVITGVETLPYTNEIEALQYGTPSVYTNDTMLLYVLSMPKLSKVEYNLILTRPSIVHGKQVDLRFEKMLVNHEETYGMLTKCLSISNLTVCEEKDLEKVAEDDCIARLLKGGHAACTFRSNTAEIVELVKEDTIFVTNFKGRLIAGGTTKELSGTYVIQMNNETVQLNNRTFSSLVATSLQVLPAVLTNITAAAHRIDIEYVHDISVRNIKLLGALTKKFKFSSAIDAVLLLLIAAAALIIWRKINRKVDIPAIQMPGPGLHPPSISSQH